VFRVIALPVHCVAERGSSCCSTCVRSGRVNVPSEVMNVRKETTGRPAPPKRLDSWKAIAAYMGRSCRTVQRWHSQGGLPIHHLGGEKGSAFAFSDELDRWLMSRGLPHLNTSQHTLPLPVQHATHPREAVVHSFHPAVTSFTPHSSRVRSADLVALAYGMWKTLSHSNLHLINQHFREAIDLDPCNALAFAGLGNALVAQGALGLVRAPIAYRVAQAALNHALEIDPENASAKCALAWYKMCLTRDWLGAHSGLVEAAKLLRPPSIRALAGQGMLMIAEGRLHEAANLLQKAAEHNTLNSIVMGMYCWSEYMAGEYPKALHLVEQSRATGHFGLMFDAVEALSSVQAETPCEHIARMEALAAESPQHHVLQGALGYAYAVNCQRLRASQILDALTHKRTMAHVREPYAVALLLIGLNERQKAIQLLEQSYREGSLWSLGFRSDPILKSLGYDLHYSVFLSRVSYPQPYKVGEGIATANRAL